MDAQRQCYDLLIRVTELSALLTQSQKQNEDYEKDGEGSESGLMEILVCDLLFWKVGVGLWVPVLYGQEVQDTS